MTRKYSLIAILSFPVIAIFSLYVSGCAISDVKAETTDLLRDTSPVVAQTELVDGNTEFAIDLYKQLMEENDGNMFFSPFSISQAVAMVWAGARSNTEIQIADTLHFTLPQDQIHPSINQLDIELHSRAEARGGGDSGFVLNIANSIWGQDGYDWLPEYLDVLSDNYGAGLNIVDFITAPEEARTTINTWVEDKTEDLIKDLFPEGVLNDLTRLVLVNAIYFEAMWHHKFSEDRTADHLFYLLNGSNVEAPLMHQKTFFNYAEGDGWQALEMLYEGLETSMVILLPGLEEFEEFEERLDRKFLDEIINNFVIEDVAVTIPKFEMDSALMLGNALSDMGMPDAFIPGVADLSGMNGMNDLFIQAIVHKAYCMVDEEKTVAAAATGIYVGITSAMENKIFCADHPFIFFIRDIETGTILFLGRMLDPS